MSEPLVVILGVGTGIGKTHVACSMLAWAAANGIPLSAYKPIESGPRGIGDRTDAMRLADANMFHVKPPATLHFDAPLAPTLAAALQSQRIPTPAITSTIQKLRRKSALLLELPGAAFSPFDAELSNAHYVAMHPDANIVLVLPNELGVLSDAMAYTMALGTLNLRPSLFLLNTPRHADASTSRNHLDLRDRFPYVTIASLTRGDAAHVSSSLPQQWMRTTLSPDSTSKRRR